MRCGHEAELWWNPARPPKHTLTCPEHPDNRQPKVDEPDEEAE